MITAIRFDTIQNALEEKKGQGGRFFWNYDDNTGTWFPITVTRWDAMKYVQGSGFLGMRNEVIAKLYGAIGGPRGKAEPLG